MTLSERLRQAALERARRSGEVVEDGYIIEQGGVIDLRRLTHEATPVVSDRRVTLPILGLEPRPGLVDTRPVIERLVGLDPSEPGDDEASDG